LEFQVRPYPQSSDVLLDGDNQGKGNVEITDGPNGELKITIPGLISAGWRENEMVYDVKAIDVGNGNKPYRIVEGYVYMSKQTTRQT
jgi:hypothetical protein